MSDDGFGMGGGQKPPPSDQGSGGGGGGGGGCHGTAEIEHGDLKIKWLIDGGGGGGGGAGAGNGTAAAEGIKAGAQAAKQQAGGGPGGGGNWGQPADPMKEIKELLVANGKQLAVIIDLLKPKGCCDAAR